MSSYHSSCNSLARTVFGGCLFDIPLCENRASTDDLMQLEGLDSFAPCCETVAALPRKPSDIVTSCGATAGHARDPPRLLHLQITLIY